MAIGRNDVKAIFGDATDEQISELLNRYHADIEKSKEKDKEAEEKQKAEAEKLKALESEKAELAKKLEEVENGNLTEVEKANKALETANQRIAELEKAQFISNQRADAVAQFKITAEQAKEVVKDDGSFDMTKLGAIITEKESAAALAKEQEIARMSSNPNGQNGGESENSFAKDLVVGSAKNSNTANQSILDAYKR